MPSSRTIDERRPLARPSARPTLRATGIAALLCAFATATSCFDSSSRWGERPDPPPACVVGDFRCHPELERCDEGDDGPAWNEIEDCSEQGLACASALGACAPCVPRSTSCDEYTVLRCPDDGSGFERGETCDPELGEAGDRITPEQGFRDPGLRILFGGI